MPRPSLDAADQALSQFIAEIGDMLDHLRRARQQAVEAQGLRRLGHTWYAIAVGQQGPLIVQRIAMVIAALGDAGGHWRREQARALHRERLSVTRIAELYGVSRQRVSVLLRPQRGDV